MKVATRGQGPDIGAPTSPVPFASSQPHLAAAQNGPPSHGMPFQGAPQFAQYPQQGQPQQGHPGYGPPPQHAPAQARSSQQPPHPPFAQHPQHQQPPPVAPPGAPAKEPGGAPGAGPGGAPGAGPRPGPPKVSFGTKLKNQAPKLLFLALMAAGYGAYRARELRKPYEWSGTVEARQVTLGSRVGGRVKTILVNEGDQVIEGQPLMVLEAGDLLASKIVAEADVESNEAGLLKLESGARSQELQQARARVSTNSSSAASAVALLAREELELKRSRTLFASNAISKAELEQKEAAAHAAAAEVGRASASTAEASAAFQLVKTGSRSEDIRIAKASLAAARGRLDAIVNQIGELTIRAARPSRVESITVRPGDILGANAPAVTVLEDGQLYVRIYVPETQIGKVAVGQNVPITVDSFPGRTFAGKVAHINEVGEYTPRAMTTSDDRADEVFGLRIALIDGQRELRAGMVTFIHVAKR